MMIHTNKQHIFKRLKNQKGSVLVITYLVVVVLLGLGAVFILVSANETRTSERQRLATVASHIAEAGIEKALYDLRLDFLNDSTPSWADGTINTYTIGPNTSDFYTIPYTSTSLNGGSYSVSLKNVSGKEHIWIKSTGTIQDMSHSLQVYVRMIDISPWNNAIFAGAGASGQMVNGNVDIRGSVHILGTGLTSTDLAIDMGGTAQLVGNNYSTLAASLAAKVPALSTTVHNGETVSTLNSEFRVKRGIVGLSGTAKVGEANVSGNSVKETVDGAYVTDGYGGSQGTANVYSDNGTSNSYDLGDTVSFPSLSDPAPENPAVSVANYFKSNALTITANLSNLTPTSSFSYSDGTNSLSMDGSGNLSITGRVYISSSGVSGAGNLNFNKAGSNKTITYTGSGTILADGSIGVNTNLVTSGSSSFPTNVMGFMTANDISMNEANIDVMGLFYAETSISVLKQTDIMGTIVSNYFDMGTNVPAIFQVPSTVNNLPLGLISSTSTKWYLVTMWQRI